MMAMRMGIGTMIHGPMWKALVLRFRQARSGSAEPLRVGDVIVPATVTDSVTATIVDSDHDGDAADTGTHVIRPNAAHLDSRFLAMFLTAPASLRRASDERPGSRIDVRRLEVPVLPIADQERYGLAFRRLRYLCVGQRPWRATRGSWQTTSPRA
jgi:hypothetical protein